MRLRIFFIVLLGLVIGCKTDEEPVPARTFRMGFQNSAPRFDDFNLFVQALQMWVDPGDAADAAMITTEVPWKQLLEGENTVDHVVDNYKGLVEYYRQHNLKLWVYIDPANGLNRATDAQALAAVGKSIANNDMQAIYKRFVIVMDSVLKPEHLGLALETNLIRLASLPSIYNGVKKAVNEVAAELKTRKSNAVLSISVQADVAWGSLQGTFQYNSIRQDHLDFPFMEEMGLSSYPYFGYSDPADLPADYYSRIKEEVDLDVFVTEGGWASQVFIGPNGSEIAGNTTKQSDYIVKQADLLQAANATALFSLTFTDIDLDALPVGVEPSIQYFAYLGMVDKELKPKPAFEKWKEVFARKFVAH